MIEQTSSQMKRASGRQSPVAGKGFSTLPCKLGLAAAAMHGATETWAGDSGDWNTPAILGNGALSESSKDELICSSHASITITRSSGRNVVIYLTTQPVFQLTDGLLPVLLAVGANETFTFCHFEIHLPALTYFGNPAPPFPQISIGLQKPEYYIQQ